MQQTIRSIPCIIHGKHSKDRVQTAQTLANIGKCNQIPLKNISDYSKLLAHGYHMFENKGISVEELETAYRETPNPEYCQNTKKDMDSLKDCKDLYMENNPALPCLICPFGNPENETRKEMETVVLTALSERKINTSDIISIAAPSELFSSWTAVTFKEHLGECPIIRLHYHLYYTLAALLFSQNASALEPHEIAASFNHIFFPILQKYAALYSKQTSELAESFYKKICTVFYPTCTKTREEALNALQQLKKSSISKRHFPELSFKSGKPGN